MYIKFSFCDRCDTRNKQVALPVVPDVFLAADEIWAIKSKDGWATDSGGCTIWNPVCVSRGSAKFIYENLVLCLRLVVGDDISLHLMTRTP